jgi:predicted unusual protein kinase regulating ubiquinone biosynthesis (AarF/ABC1/UbiB family)
MDRAIKNRVVETLRQGEAEVPTTRLGRLRRVGATTFQGGKLAFGNLRQRTPDLATTSRLVAAIGELKGVAMKMGQLLSYIDTGLSAEVRSALWALQTQAQPMRFARVEEILRRELGGRAADLLADMEAEPFAVASIGQLHRARLADGTQVAVKVQYPGIETAIENDFGPAAVGSSVVSLFLPAAKPFVAHARARFREECDYLLEAQRQQRFAELFVDHPVLRVPEVFGDYSTARVLTTGYVEGIHLDSFLAGGPGQEERNRFGAALFDLYVGALFEHGLYNCDPHPGNYLFCADGTLAALDFGCTRQFGSGFVADLAALSLAVRSDDANLLHRALDGLGLLKAGQRYDRAAARELIRELYGPLLTDEVQLFEKEPGRRVRELLRSNRDLLKARLPGEMLFLMRLRIGLAAVLTELGAHANWRDAADEMIDRRQAAGAGAWAPPLFDVVLLDSGSNAIAVVREIRAATGVGIKEAKAMVEVLPHPVAEACLENEARQLSAQIEAAGGRAEVRPTLGTTNHSPQKPDNKPPRKRRGVRHRR